MIKINVNVWKVSMKVMENVLNVHQNVKLVMKKAVHLVLKIIKPLLKVNVNVIQDTIWIMGNVSYVETTVLPVKMKLPVRPVRIH
jgi:hypothetical protein